MASTPEAETYPLCARHYDEAAHMTRARIPAYVPDEVITWEE